MVLENSRFALKCLRLTRGTVLLEAFLFKTRDNNLLLSGGAV